MRELPCSSLPTLVQLPNLRTIVLNTMDNLEEFNTACFLGDDAANELKLAKLDYLEICDCPKLTIKPCPPKAAYWYISGSDNVLSSWGECASSSPVSKLAVDSALPLHQWRLLHHLPGLSDLTISGCYDLTISPQITRAFNSLESLSLYVRLEKLPEWLGELTSLRQLNLEMPYLQELHENMRQLAQLHLLGLYRCKTLTSLPQWLGGLTLLKTLKILSCKGIISLPESILSNLQELRISDCPELYRWYQLEENQMKVAHIKEKAFTGSTINNKCKKTMNTDETIELTKMTDAIDNFAASVHGNETDEVHPDLYSAVMDVPGFTEEALLVALSHLMDNNAQGSAYMGMQEEDRVSWLMNFLKRHY